MRIRTVKPEFFLHDGLFEAEKETGFPMRLAFAGLWCAADREGRFKWEPRRLGVSILPYDGLDFSRVLDAFLTRGFIQKYRCADAWFGVIPSFSTHQVINNRETASQIPDLSQAEEISSASITRPPRVTHAGQGEGKGKEGKGREGKKAADAAESISIPEDLLESKDEIEDWLTYKRQRGQAYKTKGLEALWRIIRAIPADLRRESVDHSMANNYAGLFQKNGGSNGHQRSTAGYAAPIPGQYSESA